METLSFFTEVDEKCRLKVPPELLPELRGPFAEAFATTADYMVVKVYPRTVWEDQVRLLESGAVNSAATKHILELFQLSGAYTGLTPDGLILIPPLLCARLNLMGASGVPIFYSCVPHPLLEVMSATSWKQVCLTQDDCNQERADAADPAPDQVKETRIGALLHLTGATEH